jgi:hypothetical protein
MFLFFGAVKMQGLDHVVYGDVASDIEEPQFLKLAEQWLKVPMTEKEERKYLVDLISSLEEHERGDLLIAFVDKMQSINEPDYSYITSLLTLPLSNAELTFVAQTIEFEFHETVREMIDILDTEMTNIGIANIKTVFDDLSMFDESSVRPLYDIAADKGQQMIAEYLHDILSAIKTHKVEKPDWIVDPPLMMTHDELVASLVLPKLGKWVSETPEKDAEFILAITSEDADLDLLYEQTLDKFRRMARKTREDLITRIMNNNMILKLSLNLKIYSVLGPCLLMPGG